MVRLRSERLFDALVAVLLVIVGLVCLIPMLYVVAVSLTPYDEYLRHGGMILIPTSITMDAYMEFIKEPYLLDSFVTTVVSTVLGTGFNIFMTVLMAYPLAKTDLMGKKFFNIFVLIPMLITGGMIPTYLVVRSTGLLNTMLVYIIPGAVWSYVLIITRSFFAQIDKGLAESARIDGAGEWTILFRLILPVSTPIIATIGLMYGVGHWNEYMSSVLYISSPELRTMQVVLREVLSRNTEASVDVTVPTKTLQMAGVVFTSLPIILVYPFLQKYFTQGMMLGAIKG